MADGPWLAIMASEWGFGLRYGRVNIPCPSGDGFELLYLVSGQPASVVVPTELQNLGLDFFYGVLHTILSWRVGVGSSPTPMVG